MRQAIRSWWTRHGARRASPVVERVRASRVLSEMLGLARLVEGSLPWLPAARRLDALLLACRRIELHAPRRLLRRRLVPFLVGDSRDVARRDAVGWRRYRGGVVDVRAAPALTTSLLLKAPGPDGEKGVLYSSFEENWMRLVANHDAAAFLERYTLVGATSWSPTDYAVLAAFAGLGRDPIFVGVSNLSDLGAIGVMRPVVEPLPILASDWIDPAAFRPRPHRERTIDLLVVANWSPVKRHWLLFEALRTMRRGLRVVLVGRDAPGRTAKEVRAEAREIGAPQDLEIHTNLETDEVAALQSDARVSAIFSRREGSCVAVAESLFAGSPVAMMEEAHIGSRAYINSRTGALLRRRGLGRALQRMWEESERYAPRAWALENIACTLTTGRLNATLREWAARTGRPWTRDIAPLCWRYVPAYLDPADETRLAPAVAALEREHGVVLEKFPGEREARRRRLERARSSSPAA